MLNEVNSKVLSKKAIEEMDLGEEDNFETMFAESIKNDKGGNIVTGVVVSIKDEEERVLVDVGKKQEGILNRSEIVDQNGELIFKVGDELIVVISGYRNERPYLSYKKALKINKVDEFISNYSPEQESIIVQGAIISKNKGGYIVDDSQNLEYFMPKSQAYLKDSENLIGKKIKAKVIKVDKNTKSIIISRKALIEEDKKRKRALVEDLLNKEEPISGVVKKITSYGMFVDVGGIDGLVHYSEISYRGPVNPSKYYEEGDNVIVKPLKYDESKGHLSLSIKAAASDPWSELKSQIEIGDTVKVEVSNIEPYGVFVDLGNDIEGFLHVSEISWDKNIKHPQDYLKVGDELDVEIVEIDFQDRKLRVSLKNLLPKPFEKFRQNYKVNDIIQGVVTTITKFGAFIKIDGVEGLLHNEDLSWDRGVRCKDVLKSGDEVELKIVRIDVEKENISLSKKELEESPIEKFSKNHKSDDILSVKVRDKKEFGLFVEVENGVDALIRIDDLGEKSFEDIEIGEELEAAIVFIDVEKNRVRLSIKRVAKIKQKEALEEFNSDQNTTLGDLIKDQLK
jgi:small subunit ribosomal protein S1